MLRRTRALAARFGATIHTVTVTESDFSSTASAPKGRTARRLLRRRDQRCSCSPTQEQLDHAARVVPGCRQMTSMHRLPMALA